MLPIDDPEQVAQWIAMHKSQVAGGKRYDLATKGRMLANATFFESHDVDDKEAIVFSMDLLPLIRNPQMSMSTYVGDRIDQFKQEVQGALKNFEAGS